MTWLRYYPQDLLPEPKRWNSMQTSTHQLSHRLPPPHQRWPHSGRFVCAASTAANGELQATVRTFRKMTQLHWRWWHQAHILPSFQDGMAVESANVSSNFAGLPIYNLQDYIFKIFTPISTKFNQMQEACQQHKSSLVLSSSSKWSKAWCHCDARSQVLMTALWVWTPAVSRPQHILLLWSKGHSLMCKLDVARKSKKIKDIKATKRKTTTSSPRSCVWISHVSIAEVLVEFDDCIHLPTSCYEKSLARSQWQSSSCFDAGKPWLKQWSRPRSTASAHRTVPMPPNPHLGCHEAPLWVTRGWLPTQAGYSSILNHIMQVVLNLVCTQGLMFPLKIHSKRMIHDDSDFTYCMTCSRISLLGRHPGLCSFISIHIKYVWIYVNMCVCV